MLALDRWIGAWGSRWLSVVWSRSRPASPSHSLPERRLRFLKGEALGAQLTVDGSWPSTDGIDVTVRSVLADPQAGYYVALAVAVAKPFFQWLPREDDHFDWQKLGDARSPIRAWTTTSPHSDRQLDRHDPYTASTALNRPR